MHFKSGFRRRWKWRLRVGNRVDRVSSLFGNGGEIQVEGIGNCEWVSDEGVVSEE